MFHERVKAFQTWQHAQQMLAKKREAVDRWESTGRTDKVAPAKDEVLEVRSIPPPGYGLERPIKILYRYGCLCI